MWMLFTLNIGNYLASKMKTILYEALYGDHINDVIQEAVLLSKAQKCFVRFKFNGVWLWASPTKSKDTLLFQWNNARESLVEQYTKLKVVGKSFKNYQSGQ